MKNDEFLQRKDVCSHMNTARKRIFMRIWVIEEESINFIVERIDKMIIIVNYQNGSVLSGFQYSDHKNNIIEKSIDIFNNKKINA